MLCYESDWKLRNRAKQVTETDCICDHHEITIGSGKDKCTPSLSLFSAAAIGDSEAAEGYTPEGVPTSFLVLAVRLTAKRHCVQAVMRKW